MPAQKRKRDSVTTPAAKPGQEVDEGQGTGDSSSKPVDASEVIQPPFTVEYLKNVDAKPNRRRTKSGTSIDDYTTPKIEASVSKFDKPVAYTILPGSGWEGMRKYKNFVVGNNTFGIHDFIYVNHSEAKHGALIPDEDEHHFWIARVLEVRAVDPQHVYLRVYWMYWPSELPTGRMSYHGKNELVASNHMEIIDAMTVSELASVEHYEETDESAPMVGLYWRQTFDFVTQKLSPLRRQCICNEFHNPDKLLIHCSSEVCNKWLHEDCIIKDALDRFHSRPMASNASRATTTDDDTIHVNETDTINVTPAAAKKKKGRSRKSDTGPKPWEGQLEASVETKGDDENKDITGKLIIVDSRGEEPKTLEEDLICPLCHQPLKPS